MIFRLIKTFVFVVICLVCLISGYLLGYIARGGASIFSINEIMVLENANPLPDHRDVLISIVCIRDTLQGEFYAFTLLDENKIVVDYQNCKANIMARSHEYLRKRIETF